MGSISELTDQINLRVARTTIRRRRDDIESAFSGALGPNPDADDLDIYFTSVGVGWTRFFLGSMVCAVVLAAAGGLLDTSSGEGHGFAIGLIPAVASRVGEADAEWRRYVARKAARSSLGSARRLRYVRIARSCNTGILLQTAVAVLAALLFWTLY